MEFVRGDPPNLALLYGNLLRQSSSGAILRFVSCQNRVPKRGGGGGWDGSRTRPETADLFWKKNMKHVLLYSKSMTDCVLEK